MEMIKLEVNEFLKSFKDVKKKEKKCLIQTQFNLDLVVKTEIDTSKVGYKTKELNKYKRFGDE